MSVKSTKGSITKFGLIELIVYSLFLAVFTLMTYVQSPKEIHYYNSILQKLFISGTFYSSSNVRDFWEVLSTDHSYRGGEFFHNFYWEEFYGSSNPNSYNVKLPNVRPLHSNERKLGILYENQLLGLPLLHQIREKPFTCPVTSRRNDFPTLDRECFPAYSIFHEDKGDKLGRWKEYNDVSPEVKDAWVYRSNTSSIFHWGKLSLYTSGSGGICLKRRKVDTEIIVRKLLENRWITRATKVVFLDFTLYNANVNLFCVIRLVWEFHPTGDLVPSYTFKFVKFIHYVTFEERYIIFPCEMLFCAFTIYFTILEFIKLFRQGCRTYFNQFWTYVEIIILIISYGCIAFKLFQYFVIQETVKYLVKDKDDYYDFQFLAFLVRQYERTVAILVFVVWVKVCKFLTFSKTMHRFSNTLAKSVKDVFGFGVMFFVIFFAFAQTGHLIFGGDILYFSTYGKSCFALLSLLIGEFSITDVQSANRILGPIFYLAFMIFVFLVIVNMFIAILNNTYSEVKAQIDTRNKFHQLNSSMERNQVKGSDVSMKDIKQRLSELNFTRGEIELFSSRFDLLDDSEPSETHSLSKIKVDTNVDQHEEQTLQSQNIVPDASLQVEEYFELHRRLQSMESKYTHSFNQLSHLLEEVNQQIESLNNRKSQAES